MLESLSPHDIRKTADALLRDNLYLFLFKVFETLNSTERLQPANYLEALCKAFQDTAETEGGRLLVTVPPRYLKSTSASVALAAFYLGKNPGAEVMVATYAAEFATLHANQFRTIVETPWYQHAFPRMRISKRDNRADEVRTTLNGGRKAVAIGGSVTGRGADLLIIDDLLKAADARSETARRNAEMFFEDTLLSRLNDKKRSSIIVLQQRLHEDDFAGYVLGKGTFVHLNFPAIATLDSERHTLFQGRSYVRRKGDVLSAAREDRETLELRRIEMTEAVFSAQYQQDPIPAGGNEFDIDKVAAITMPPERSECAPVVQSWDPAYTTSANSAYSACTTWGKHDGKWYLLDVLRDKLTFPALRDKVVAHKKRWQADQVIIEGAGSGTQLVQQLRRDGGHLEVLTTKIGVGNKEARLIEQSARLLGGDFVIATSPHWYRDLRHEFRAFPNGKYADQVDSVTQFVAWASSPMGLARTRAPGESMARMPHEIRRR